MDCLTDAVQDHSGYIVDYYGDGLVAMWNAPAIQDEHPDLACRAGWVIDRYSDAAVGRMERDAQGRLAMTLVTLHPQVDFAGPRRPDAAEIERLHHAAHDECYIANSVKTTVRCEPILTD